MKTTFYTTTVCEDQEIEIKVVCSGDFEEADPEVGLHQVSLNDVTIEAVTVYPGGHDLTAFMARDPRMLDEASDALWEAREAKADTDAGLLEDYHDQLIENRRGH